MPPGVSDETAANKFKADWKARREQIWKDNGWPTPDKFDNETLPPGLYAINPPAPSWLYDNVAISRGYLDDACDGFVEVRIARQGEDPDHNKLKAQGQNLLWAAGDGSGLVVRAHPRRRSRSGRVRSGG